MPEPTHQDNTPNQAGGLRPFPDRARRPMVGGGFTDTQLQQLRDVIRLEVTAVLKSLFAQPQPLTINNTSPNLTAADLKPAVVEAVIAATVEGTATKVDIVPPAAPAVQPGGPAPETNATTGLVLATDQNTPGATPAMILLINEQTDAAKHQALREIAMSDVPHQARLAKMRQYLAATL